MSLIRYDQMDPAKARRIMLEICPNCHLQGKVYRDANSVTYIHTAWRRWRTRRAKRRHYCKMSNDGRELEVVIPVLRAKEKHELQQDNTL